MEHSKFSIFMWKKTSPCLSSQTLSLPALNSHSKTKNGRETDRATLQNINNKVSTIYSIAFWSNISKIWRGILSFKEMIFLKVAMIAVQLSRKKNLKNIDQSNIAFHLSN